MHPDIYHTVIECMLSYNSDTQYTICEMIYRHKVLRGGGVDLMAVVVAVALSTTTIVIINV